MYSWQQQQNEYRQWQQAQQQQNQQWREQMSQYQTSMGQAGFQQADPNNAYQKYLKASNFNQYFDPNAYQSLLQQQQQTAGVYSQVAQDYRTAQQQLAAQHKSAYDTKLQQFMQQRGISPEQYQSNQVYYDQQGRPQVVRSLDTHHGQVRAPTDYKDMLNAQIAKGQIPQFQRPPEIEFHKLSPEEFQDQILYYRPSCVHCVNLLSHMAKDPLLDSKVTKINIDQHIVQGLQGVPTIVDERKQVFLGDDALRWVNAKATKDVIGMALNDVSAAPTSDLVPGDPGENFSFVNEGLLNMPKVDSLYAIDTRKQRGPNVDQVLGMIESQRNQLIRPHGDPGTLTPVAALERQQLAQQQAQQPQAQQYAQQYPQQYPPQYAPQFAQPGQLQQPQRSARPSGPMEPGVAASQLFNRPLMNPSQKAVQNRSYEMSRSAFLGDSSQMSRRYQ